MKHRWWRSEVVIDDGQFYSSCTCKSSENICCSSGGAQEKRKEGVKTGWNSVWHQNWCTSEFHPPGRLMYFFASFFKISPGVGPNSGFWCCVFLTLFENSTIYLVWFFSHTEALWIDTNIIDPYVKKCKLWESCALTKGERKNRGPCWQQCLICITWYMYKDKNTYQSIFLLGNLLKGSSYVGHVAIC